MPAVPTGPNVVPGRYRGVSVAALPPDVGLDAASLRAYFVGRDAYRRTRFVVARSAAGLAVLHVEKVPNPPDDPDGPLFAPIVGTTLLAGPDECAWVHDPEVDTAIPSALAAAAATVPGARAVVVQGRYEHVNFILDARPLRIVVREVVPPEPAKLFDQAQRLLAITEDLPPIELVSELTDLGALAAEHPAQHYLLPCRGSGSDVEGAQVSYLDEHPPQADWTLLGCTRSQQIHEWFYGTEVPVVDFCPKRAPGPRPPVLLTKCCMQEEHTDSGPGWATVPWGSSLEHVREALRTLAAQQEPVWAPV
ncbi:hypothetical protein I4J48_21750 [Pseudonocardia sp. KRD-169]|uniref:Uncharacterized protein n=1 Tax=Pseudonocardia abyssalis TaxID=2792008 RepID=A0ABS6UQF7_9PSEU|nr:hypothetical protein [Pseudonocardia abyssalis]MBW0134457.1 hypothetical protein [Pseudonocardia abyssalis]